jgi:AcrR family transcriptional regulator
VFFRSSLCTGQLHRCINTVRIVFLLRQVKSSVTIPFAMTQAYPHLVRGRPRDEEADGAILDAALALLSQQGYGGLRMEGVAAKAGVAKATVYRRWPDKLSLAIAAIERLPELPPVNTGSLLGDLRALRAALVALFKTTRLAGVMPALAAERMRHTAAAAKIDALIQTRYQPWISAIERAVARGELPRSSKVADSRLIADLLAGVLILRVFFTGGRVDEHSWETVMAIVINGIRANARPAGQAPAPRPVKIKQRSTLPAR